jgi:Tol biopolymer transport system component/predicted Ser/Thr protein kinase
MSPQAIAHYRITSKLGQGGMGEVYRATDTKLGREVAIKVIPEAFAQDADRMARLTREAQVLASLNHPNIGAIYGVEERALVMELVEGETVSGPLPIDTALNYARQIADALEAAHEKGIVHRDLKPANIMITPAGVIKVLDFGLAAVVHGSRPGSDPANSRTLTVGPTQAGVIIGTAGYMSPEQARGNVVDKRADIWAFGVVLYEMLTGRRLFQSANLSDTLAAVIKDEPRWDGIPLKVHRLLKSCLQKDPKRRLRDIGDAWGLLEEAPAPTVLRRLPWAVAATLAAGLAIALWAPWRVTRPVDRPLLQFSVDLGPDSLPGLRTTAVLSPDGTRVVFPSRGLDGRTRFSIRLLNQPKATPLSGTENGTDPFFSPDGQWIGFFADNKMKKISVEGGGAVTLCDVAAGRGGSWGEDGNIIAASTVGGLFRVPEAGGSPQPLTKPSDKGEVSHRWPQVLPGGQSVLFTVHTSPVDWDDASIAFLSLKTGQRNTVQRSGYFGRYLPSGYLVYIHQGVLFGVPFDPGRGELRGTPTPLLEEVAVSRVSGSGQFDFSRSGTLVYLSGKSPESYPIVWLDRAGKTQPLLATPGDYGMPRLSPDGRSLALDSRSGGGAASGIVVYDLQRDNMTKITFAGPNTSPVWTPDGKHIVYVSRTGTGYSFMWIRADGAGEPQLLMESKAVLWPYSFSPDGKRLAYSAISPETSGDLWVLPLDISGPNPPKPGKAEAFLRTAAAEYSPAFSPDGRWMAYQSGPASPTTDVYVRPFPGPGGNWQISEGGGSFPVWSRDGRELLYGTPDGHIMAAFSAQEN